MDVVDPEEYGPPFLPGVARRERPAPAPVSAPLKRFLLPKNTSLLVGFRRNKYPPAKRVVFYMRAKPSVPCGHVKRVNTTVSCAKFFP